MRKSMFDVLPHYYKLEAELKLPDKKMFISDYNGGHRYIDEYLGDLASIAPLRLGDISRYSAIDEDLVLRSKFAALNTQFDGVTYGPENVVPSAGSSSLIGSICNWLQLAGCNELHYIPPIFFKIVFWIQKYNINPICISDMHAMSSNVELRLPKYRSILFLTDPVWYAGLRVPQEIFDQILDWQSKTGSLVIVDGTFQYMRWDMGIDERSGTLIPEQTIRILCPTKCLSIHGYRSAYLLVPGSIRDEFGDFHLNLHGDASLSDRLFAHRACDVMSGQQRNEKLLQIAKLNYNRLVEAGAVGNHMNIESGYFLFTEIRASKEKFLYLDQRHFELAGYPNYVRVNLLSENIVDALIGEQ